MKILMKQHKFPGKLVVFCGVDGAGKSTLISDATSILSQMGVVHSVIKMPSDRIRQMDVFRDYHDSHDEELRHAASALALTILVSGDRMISLEQDVVPRLKRGEWVLCDRYVFSGLACADGDIVRLITNEFIEPDLAILATASPTTVKQRVKARENEAHKFYDDADAEKKIAKFLSIAGELSFFSVFDTEGQRTENASRLEELIHTVGRRN